MKQLSCKEHLSVKVLIKVKNRSEVRAVDVNHGVKKELDVHVKDLSVLHNGAAVVLYLDQFHAATATNFLRKFVA